MRETNIIFIIIITFYNLRCRKYGKKFTNNAMAMNITTVDLSPWDFCGETESNYKVPMSSPQLST